MKRSLSEVVKSAPSILSRTLSTLDSLSSCPSHRWFIVNGYSSIDKHESDPKTLAFTLLTQLQQHGSPKSPYILNKIISFCSRSHLFDVGIQVHSAIVKLGFTSNVYITTALVDLYGKCGRVTSAHQVFDEMPLRNVVTWNSLTSGYLLAGCPEKALGLFLGMIREGSVPSAFGVSVALVGCSQLEAVEFGAQIHGLSLKNGVSSSVVVGTCLVDMYAKCWSLAESRRVFDLMQDKNAITWTTIVSGYAHNELPYEAMILFREMQRLALRSDFVAYNCLLSSFSGKEHLDHCRQIHCCVTREGLDSNAYIQISLVTAYAECRCSLEDFDKTCLTITIWDQISWNAVIAGFSHLECAEEALECFSNMRRAGIDPDFVTVTSVLRAIGVISALDVGKQVHALAFKIGSSTNLFAQNGLISMYGKCGLINDAKRVFLAMKEHDLVSWNSLIAAYSHHGYSQEVIELFEEMIKTRILPDYTTFTSVISACSHTGLVEKGLEYFDMLRKLDPCEPLSTELYASMVDMLSRAGYLNEAEAFINSMPIKPGYSVYKSLLSACKVYGNTEVGERVSNMFLEHYPNDAAAYVLLSNSLATQGCWDESEGIWKLLQHRKAEKEPGYSWIGSSK